MKLKLIHTGVFTMMLGILFSCTSDAPFDVIPQTPVCQSYTGYKIAPEDAAKYAAEIVAQLDENQTRAERSLASIELLSGNSKTRSSFSNVPDSSLYVVNFDDNAGFAIVSADVRLKPFYAVSDSGSFNINDTTENKGLARVMNSIYEDINMSYGLPLPGVVDTIIWNKPVLPPAPPIGSGYDLVEKMTPLIHPSVAKWGQYSPYNNDCPFVTDPYGMPVRAMVGCAPLAVGMIFSYFEWPTSYNGVTIPWTEIKNGATNNYLPTLLRHIGDPDALNALYLFGGTGANIPFNGPKTFRKFGYKLPAAVKDLNVYSTYLTLKNNSPVIMIAGDSSKDNSEHTWVVDGYAVYKYTVQQYETYGNLDYYFHMIWGWDGDNNGYFLLRDSNPSISGGAYKDCAESNDDTSSTLYYNFDTGIQTLGGFTPDR